MSEARRDPYEVLGLPRDASARAVKSAYFALVREFPPETHPAEFQELRDAYELLSDPARREELDAAHDALADVGTEQAALLRAAREAFAQDDVAGGEAMLRRLAEDHPDLLVAREQLGLSYLRRQAWDDAVRCWTQLAERDPRSPRYAQHLGYALQGAGRRDQAIVQHRRAVELGGGPEARVALADALVDAGGWMEAVRVLDEGIDAAGERPPPPLVRAKVSILLLHGAARRAWAAFDRLVQLVRGDEQERAAHAEELASLAAWLFAKGEEPLANGLLRRLAALDPARRPDRLFPRSRTVRVADLPPASVDWLEGKVPRPERFVARETSRARTAALLVPGLVLLWWSLGSATGDAPWGDGTAPWLLALFTATALALLWGGSRFHAAVGARLGRLDLVHPAYYLELRHDLLRAYPLVNLHDVQVVHHSTNGSYTHSVVHLPFGKRRTSRRFRRHSDAVGFAEALMQRRRRMLELLANGLLETEEGIDLIPAPLLWPGRRPRWPYAVAGAAAAAGLALWLAAGLHARAVERREWTEARVEGTPAALRRLLERHPDRAGLVREVLASWVQDMESGPERLPPGPGRETALAIVRALAAGAPGDVAFRIRWADGAARAPAGPNAGAGPGAACPFQPEREAAALAAALQASFDAALGPRLVRLAAAAPPEAVAIDVLLSPRAAGRYRAEGVALPELHATALDYTIQVRVPGAAPRELRGSAPPPAAVALAAPARTAGSPPEPDQRLRLRDALLTPGRAPPLLGRLEDLGPEQLAQLSPEGRLYALTLREERRRAAEAARPPPPRVLESPEEACAALRRAQASALEAGIAGALGVPRVQREVAP